MREELQNTSVNEAGLAVGDYVFATHFRDCDPGDPWAVGFVAKVEGGYVMLADAHGNVVPGVGSRWWRYAMKIDREAGDRILALYPGLQQAPFDGDTVSRIVRGLVTG